MCNPGSNMPGSSPSGSRVIRQWGRNRRPGKNLFNYRYRGRLETDSVVGELVEKSGWITGLHGIPITTYVGHRRLSILPKERRHWGLPGPILEALAKSVGLVRTLVPDGNSTRKMGKKRHGGISLSRNWSDFFIFQVCLYTFLLYIRMNTESRGGQQTWPLSQSGASYKIIQRSWIFTSSSSHEVCWHYMALSDTGQLTRKLIFPGVIFS